ncbi:hypothetical protein [Endozoicomonas sp. SCSIO W0465]|uniref:hypothetical protein n=1 Tax=Endozoicomonas sp. SCSIO W0465 TaxID=2918516 RepID=UPI002074E115|nr:hypothetical protein [Endozoicomonas sp. SCSIO W0465]USE35283.1 hypothetical protein MJO57_24765 [Endozoicomonas sp. SCSIO W0465]
MDWRNNVISEFAEAMGIRGFDFGDTGVACFEIEGAGSLYMEQKEDGILMYLAREIDPFNNLPILENALAECHYKKSVSYPLQVGVRENQLVICLFVDDSDFTRPTVESAMQFLINKADELIS